MSDITDYQKKFRKDPCARACKRGVVRRIPNKMCLRLVPV